MRSEACRRQNFDADAEKVWNKERAVDVGTSMHRVILWPSPGLRRRAVLFARFDEEGAVAVAMA